MVGPERAENLSPTGWLYANEMMFSIHSDAPVTFRIRCGCWHQRSIAPHTHRVLLGPSQRIEPLIALKSMTIWPAYQHFEETTKGSIEVGKAADFVILSDTRSQYAKRNWLKSR